MKTTTPNAPAADSPRPVAPAHRAQTMTSPTDGELRDDFANAAMGAIVGNTARFEDHPGVPFRVWKWVGRVSFADADDTRHPANWAIEGDAVARFAYAMADAMLAARAARRA
jgi:hypothetical protein